MKYLQEFLTELAEEDVELIFASAEKASCADLHLRIISNSNVSDCLDSNTEIYIPNSEIEIEKYTSSMISYTTIGWWTEFYDMIPLMANNKLSDSKKDYILTEFPEYDRRDLFSSDFSEEGIATLAHVWGKKVEQEAIQDVMSILQSTGTSYVPTEELQNFDLTYHSLHNFRKVDIQPSQMVVRLFPLRIAIANSSNNPFFYYSLKSNDIIEYLSNSDKWKKSFK